MVTIVFLLFVIFVILGVLLLCLKHPQLMTTILIFYTLLQDITLYFTGSGFSFLSNMDLFDELILVGLTASWILRIFVYKKLYRKTPIDGIIFLFLIFYFFSAFLHQIPIPNTVFGIRDVLFFILLFYVLIQFTFKKEYFLKMIRGIFVIGYINLVVLFIQWGILIMKTSSFFLEDEATGLMGPSGAHKLGYFAGILLLSYVGFFKEGVFKNKLTIMALLIIIVLSSTRAVILYVPVALIILFWRDMFRDRRVLLYLIGTFAILFFIVQVYLLLPDTGSASLDPKVLYLQQSRETLGDFRYTRTGFLRLTGRYLQEADDSYALFWGLGPGWYASKTASRLGSPHFDSFQQLPVLVDPTISQIPILLGEYGLVGTLIVGLIFLKLYFAISNIHKNSQDRYLRGFSLATKGSIIFYLMAAMSSNAFEIQQLSIIPWFLAGSSVAIYYQLKNEKSGANHL